MISMALFSQKNTNSHIAIACIAYLMDSVHRIPRSDADINWQTINLL